MEERIKTPDSKQKSNFALAVLLLLGITLLAVSIVWVIRQYRYNTEQVVIPGDGGRISISIFPDNRSTRAAAQYLAYAVEQATGTKAEIKTETDDDEWNINIVCDPEGFEQKQQRERAHIIFVTEAAAASVDGIPYSLVLEKKRLNLIIPDGKNCFGAAKAVADRWIQDDCGLRDSGKLVISQAILDEQLSSLPIEVTGAFRILSQNLRNQDDGEGKTIAMRSARFFQLIEDYQPDLIGTQECTWQWLQLLEAEFSDRYELFGCSRLGSAAKSGEWNTILYRKDRFIFRDGETFWLSNTPSTEASKLNYEGAVRICTWALLEDTLTGKQLLFSNTHLQNNPGDPVFFEEVRARQAEILLNRLRKNGNRISLYPGFLTGDFNGASNELFYSNITRVYSDAQDDAITDSSSINYTFHNYGTEHALIDFCFHSPKNTTILDYRILDDCYDGYVSDHYGVLVTALAN